jgi:type I restriction enzyme S subunit
MTKWQTVKLSDVAYEVSDRVDNPSASGYDRFVGLDNFVSGDFKISNWSGTDNLISAMKLFKAGDTLFARRNAYLKRVSMADFDGICSGDAIVLRNKEKMIDGFLPLILNTDKFWEYTIANAAGSMSKRVRVEDLMKYEFLLPPVDEQRRITNMLWAADNHLSEINLLLESLVKIRKSYVVEKFNQIFKDNSRIVSMTQAGEVLMGRQRSPQYEKGISPRPYLRVANVYDGYVDTTDVKTMDFSDKEYETFGLKHGDVLLVEGHSSAEVVGRSLIYKDEVPGSCFQNTLIRFRTKSVSPEFAHQYFRYCLYTREFSRIAKQTTIAHLGSTRFAKMKFPLVSKDIDDEITKTISEIEASIAQTQQQISANKNLKSQMFTSMLGNNIGEQ